MTDEVTPLAPESLRDADWILAMSSAAKAMGYSGNVPIVADPKVIEEWLRAILSHLRTPRVEAGDDKGRLDALASNYWDLRCFDIPTGQGDADVGWRVIEHHEAEPRERVVAEVFMDRPRIAIDEAMRHEGGEATRALSRRPSEAADGAIAAGATAPSRRLTGAEQKHVRLAMQSLAFLAELSVEPFKAECEAAIEYLRALAERIARSEYAANGGSLASEDGAAV